MRPHSRQRPSPDRRGGGSPSRRSRMSRASPHSPNGRSAHYDGRNYDMGNEDEPTPICRCRVLYLGSAVPHVTKDGLQGIQEPLKELYPEDGALGAKGIDSWLSVWSNGFLLENVDENRKKVTRFFPIDSLHYCAAVRYVLVPGTSGDQVQRFLPLDSPFARNPNINHPPLFAAILRRTTGIKVLECHVFICKRETAANALVRCSFHAYADSTYAKHLENGQSIYGTLGGPTPVPPMMAPPMMATPLSEGAREYQQSVIEVSEDSINSIEKVEEWKVLANGSNGRHQMHHQMMPNGTSSPNENGNHGNPDEISVFNGDDNHKVWAGKTPIPAAAAADPQENPYDYGSTMRSFRSSVSGLSHRNRPRQMVMPSSPPPPPIPEELQQSPTEKKKRKKRSKSRDTHGEDMPMLNGDVPMRSNNSVLNESAGLRSASAMGGARKPSAASLMGMRGPPPPMNGHGPPRGMWPPPPHPMMMGGPPPHPGGPPPPMTGKSGKKSGTFSSRSGKGSRGHVAQPFWYYPPNHPAAGPPPPMMGHPPPFPPHLMPPPGHPIYGMPHGMPPARPGSRTIEEPIYMPHNARPLSPVASYQPGHFPHEAYYNQQQYATIDKATANGKYKKNKKNKNSAGSSKHVSSDSNAEDSEFGAGIYKKGHINERAFSYSIRNEHRSRSFGSLANMTFGPNGEPIPPGATSPPNGNGIAGGAESPDAKKERELIQMVGDLDLAEDQIERSEVPPGFYPPGPGRPPPVNMYGPPPHMAMMADPMMAGGPGRRRR